MCVVCVCGEGGLWREGVSSGGLVDGWVRWWVSGVSGLNGCLGGCLGRGVSVSVCVCVCVYVCVCMCMCVCVYVCACMHPSIVSI